MTQVASGSPLHSAPPNACRAPPHDSTPTASFDVCLLDLLWPQPPLTSSLHQGSTLGPLISVVAAFVKDARPSRWLAPLKRPRWPHHRPSLKQSAGARAAAVAGGPTAMGLVDFSRREGSRAACGACAWIAPSGAGFIRDPEGEALAKTALLASISGDGYLGLDIGPSRANRSGKNWLSGRVQTCQYATKGRGWTTIGSTRRTSTTRGRAP